MSFPPAPEYLGFCVDKIIINGEVVTDIEIQSAVEIPLNNYVDTIGQPVKIEIIHPSGCQPRILNPHSTCYPPKFEIAQLFLDSSALLQWTATKEMVFTYWEVEQYRWNRWVRVGKVRSLRQGGPNEYSFDVSEFLHSGENRFRLKKMGVDEIPRYSETVALFSEVEVESFKIDQYTETIVFNHSTMYEIYDAYGGLKKVGNSQKVKIGNLDRGTYYLNYGNVTEEFVVH